MEVKEVQRKRSELENTIYNLILDFQNTTGTKVNFVHLSDNTILGERFPQIIGVRISLEI